MISNIQRWGRSLRSLFNPPGADSFGVVGDVMPMMPLTTPDQSEHFHFRDERLFEGSIVQAAVLASVPIFWISSGVGMLTVLEELIVESATAQRIMIGYGWNLRVRAGMTAISVSIDVRDVPKSRWVTFGESFATRAVLTATTTAATTPVSPTLKTFSVLANVPQVLRTRYVFFAPGQEFEQVPGGAYGLFTLFLAGFTVNTDLKVSWRGYERKYEPSEITDW